MAMRCKGGTFEADKALLKKFGTLLGRKAELVLLYDSNVQGVGYSPLRSAVVNKGPTVTIALMADGTVCGGYAERAWGPGGNYQADPSAFIFRLKYRGTLAPYKPTQSNTSQAVYDHSNYGPTFGGGHDLVFYYSSNNNGIHNPSSYSYPSDPKTGGSYPITGGHSSLSGPGAFVVQAYQVLLKPGAGSGSTYTTSTLPPLLYPSVPACGPEALSDLREKLLVSCHTCPPPSQLPLSRLSPGLCARAGLLPHAVLAAQRAGLRSCRCRKVLAGALAHRGRRR